jgi:hypothetical protein
MQLVDGIDVSPLEFLLEMPLDLLSWIFSLWKSLLEPLLHYTG